MSAVPSIPAVTRDDDFTALSAAAMTDTLERDALRDGMALLARESPQHLAALEMRDRVRDDAIRLYSVGKRSHSGDAIVDAEKQWRNDLRWSTRRHTPILPQYSAALRDYLRSLEALNGESDAQAVAEEVRRDSDPQRFRSILADVAESEQFRPLIRSETQKRGILARMAESMRRGLEQTEAAIGLGVAQHTSAANRAIANLSGNTAAKARADWALDVAMLAGDVRDVRRQTDPTAPPNAGTIQRGVLAAAESVPYMAGGAAATMAGGLPGALAFGAAVMAPDAYRDMRRQGFGESAATWGGLLSGGIESVIERWLPFDEALLPKPLRDATIKGVRQRIGAVLRERGAAFVKENLEEVAQDVTRNSVAEIASWFDRNGSNEWWERNRQMAAQLPETAVAVGAMLAPGAALRYGGEALAERDAFRDRLRTISLHPDVVGSWAAGRPDLKADDIPAAPSRKQFEELSGLPKDISDAATRKAWADAARQAIAERDSSAAAPEGQTTEGAPAPTSATPSSPAAETNETAQQAANGSPPEAQTHAEEPRGQEGQGQGREELLDQQSRSSPATEQSVVGASAAPAETAAQPETTAFDAGGQGALRGFEEHVALEESVDRRSRELAALLGLTSDEMRPLARNIDRIVDEVVAANESEDAESILDKVADAIQEEIPLSDEDEDGSVRYDAATNLARVETEKRVPNIERPDDVPPVRWDRAMREAAAIREDWSAFDGDAAWQAVESKIEAVAKRHKVDPSTLRQWTLWLPVIDGGRYNPSEYPAEDIEGGAQTRSWIEETKKRRAAIDAEATAEPEPRQSGGETEEADVAMQQAKHRTSSMQPYKMYGSRKAGFGTAFADVGNFITDGRTLIDGSVLRESDSAALREGAEEGRYSKKAVQDTWDEYTKAKRTPIKPLGVLLERDVNDPYHRLYFVGVAHDFVGMADASRIAFVERLVNAAPSKRDHNLQWHKVNSAPVLLLTDNGRPIAVVAELGASRGGSDIDLDEAKSRIDKLARDAFTLDLESLSMTELRDLAKQLGVKPKGSKKADVLAAIQQHEGSAPFPTRPPESAGDAARRVEREDRPGTMARTMADAGDDIDLPPLDADTDERRQHPVSRHEIVAMLGRLFDVPIRFGRIANRRAAGIYKHFGRFSPQIVRLLGTYAGHIGVAMHEVAHHIARITSRAAADGRKRRYAYFGLSDDVEADLRALDYDPKRVARGGAVNLHEGFAEFVRMYMTRDDIEQRAPHAHKWFTQTFLKQHPQVAAGLEQAREFIDQFRRQRAEQIALADLRTGRRGWGPGLGESLAGFLGDEAKTAARTIYAAMIDRFLAAREIADMRREQGADDAEGTRAYDLLTAFTHTSSVHADDMIRRGVYRMGESGFMQRISAGIPEILKDIHPGDDYRNFSIYAWARHALDSWALGKNPGMARDVAEQIVARHASERYDKAADGLTAYNNALLDMLVDAGVTEKADAERMKAAHPHYLPLLRVLPDSPAARLSARLVGENNPVHARRGSDHPVLDPVLGTMLRVADFVHAAIKQQTLNQLWREISTTEGAGRMAERVPPGRKVVTFTAEEIRQQLMQQAQERGIPLEWPESSDPDEYANILLSVYRPNYGTYEGRPVQRISVTDPKTGASEPIMVHFEPEMLRMVGGMDEEKLPYFLEITLGKGAALFKLGATGLNLKFSATNLVRDALAYAFQTDQSWLDPATWYAPAAYIGRYVRTKAAHLDGREGHPVVELALRMGLERSTRIGHVTERRGAQVLGDLVADSAASRIRANLRSPGSLIDALGGVVQASEVGPRLAEFAGSLKRDKWLDRVLRGETPPRDVLVRAAIAMRDVTTNFTRGGYVGRRVNQVTTGYINAGIQGLDKFARTWKKHPLRQSLRYAAAAAALLAYWVARRDDDDYADMKAYLKYSHWTLGAGGKTLVRIKRQPEWGVLMLGALEAALNGLHGDESAAGQWAWEAAKQNVPGLELPYLTPAAEAYFDYDTFRERKIDPVGKSGSTAFHPYTTESAKAIGALLGVSPARLEHLLQGLTGGGFRGVVKPLENVAHGKLPWGTPEDLPFSAGFVIRSQLGASQSVADFYEARDDAKERHGASPTRETADAVYRLNRYATLMGELRDAIPPNAGKEERWQVERHIIGLARRAVGARPLASMPDPLTATSTSPSVAKIVSGWKQDLVKHVTERQPNSANPETMHEWFRRKRLAMELLSSGGR